MTKNIFVLDRDVAVRPLDSRHTRARPDSATELHVLSSLSSVHSAISVIYRQSSPVECSEGQTDDVIGDTQLTPVHTTATVTIDRGAKLWSLYS